jgi:two-component system CheB/CheR fusion protein
MKKQQAPPHQALEKSSPPGIPIVGIGASAGGIDALKHFFPAVNPTSGMAFVVVQHLDPDRRSILSDLLARETEMPVTTIEDETLVEADHVYVIPPNASLTIARGRLHLARPVERRGIRTPVDVFLVSLAEDRGENCACVILSGTGSDGTIGLRAIKGAGGLTLAQEGAEYDGMMRSALATGLVDFVLPAREMPAKLADYFRRRPRSTRRTERTEKAGKPRKPSASSVLCCGRAPGTTSAATRTRRSCGVC